MPVEPYETEADITNLQKAFVEQQEKISALKELVNKSESAQNLSKNATQEKVKIFAEQLIQSKAHSRQKLYNSMRFSGTETIDATAIPTSEVATIMTSSQMSSSGISAHNSVNILDKSKFSDNQSILNSAGKEKILLLHQQLQQNKLRMAQKAYSKQHLEQLMSHLKEKFDASQKNLKETNELGKSMSDLTALVCASTGREQYKSTTDLCAPHSFSLEAEHIKFLENRCGELQMQEKAKHDNYEKKFAELEKTLSASQMDNVLLKQEIKDKQKKLAFLVAQLELQATNLDKSALKIEQISDIKESKLLDKKKEMKYLVHKNEYYTQQIEELNGITPVLETTRCELDFKNGTLKEQTNKILDNLIKGEIDNNNEQLEKIIQNDDRTKAIEANDAVKIGIAREMNRIDELNVMREESQQLKESLNKSNIKEISDTPEAETIESLEITIKSLNSELEEKTNALSKKEKELMEKAIELNVLHANFKTLEQRLSSTCKSKPLFSSKLEDTEHSEKSELRLEMLHLKQKLDDSNKTIIKLKLRCKQLEKQIEKIKNNSDLPAELELENEKSKLEKSAQNTSDFIINPADMITEFENKITNLSISLNEKEEELIELRKSNQTHVKFELTAIRLEEQISNLNDEINANRNDLHSKTEVIKNQLQQIDDLNKQKEVLHKKLEHYLNENVELLYKLEKLSKSSSSAESIEILERLTQQERAEIEEFSKCLDCTQKTKSASLCTNNASSAYNNSNLRETYDETNQLTNLREECSELKSKIDLFTNERKEVLQKIEHLNSENHKLLRQIEERNQENLQLQSKLTLAENTKLQLEKTLYDLSKEKKGSNLQVAESDIKKLQTSQGLNSLQKSSEVVASLDNGDTLFAKCEKCLTNLHLELNAYRNAVDKRLKFNISKKLAKEAENVYTQLSELLQKVREASNAVETVTVVETVVAVTAPNGKALAEYEQLTDQNRALKAKVSELKSLLNEPRKQNVIDDLSGINQTCVMEQLQDNENYKKKCKELQMKIVELVQQLEEARGALGEKSNNFALQNHFERISKNKELNYQELEAKCITYEKEMKLLQSLINEQKEKLIIIYKECEEQVNLKNFKIQIQEKKIQEMIEKNSLLKDCNIESIDIIAHQKLKEQSDKLNETLQINKILVQEQLNELVTKQDTIDALNQQITDLCNTIQQHANELKQKDKEIHSLQQSYSTNKIEYSLLVDQFKDIEQANFKLKGLNKQQKDALNKQNQELLKLQNDNNKLEAKIQELETQAKEQSQKLKKYSANLEKKINECHEYEIKLNNLMAEDKLKNSSHAKLVQATSEMQTKLLAESEILQKYENTKIELEQQVRLLNITISDKKSTLLQLQEDFINIKDQNVKLEDEVKHLQNDLIKTQEHLKPKTYHTDELNELLDSIHISATKGMQRLYIEIKDDEQQTERQLKPNAPETGNLDNLLPADREYVSDDANEPLIYNTNNANLSLLTDTSNKLKGAELSVKEIQTELFQLRVKEKEFAKQENKIMDQLNQKGCHIKELKNEIRTEKTTSVSTNTDGRYEDICAQLENQMQKLQQVKDELETKSIKFEKSKSIIKDRNMQIQRLQIQLKDLQNKLQSLPEEMQVLVTQTQLSNSSQSKLNLEFNALKESYNKLNECYAVEKRNFQDTITRLETLHDGIQAKLQDDMSYINNLELENKKFKDKICRLEECVTIFEERRSSMERKVRLIDDQMQRNSEQYAKTEDELIYRLNTLSDHDDIIARRLIDAQTEKEELECRCLRLQTNLSELQAKFESVEKEYTNYKSSTTTDYEHELSELQKKINRVTCNAENLKAEYESKLSAKNQDFYDLQHELQKRNEEKRHIVEQLDRCRDQCSNLKREIVCANESANNLEQIKIDLEREITWLRMQNDNNQQDAYELQELRMQSIQDKTEIENLRNQCDNLKSSYETELQGLRNQIAELDSLRMQVGQNQTDDQVFIETENKRLTDLLAEKTVIIEAYQRQILQLQMVDASATTSNATVSTVPITIDGGFAPINGSLPEEADLRQELSEKSLLIMHLQQDLNSLHREIDILRESNGANLPTIGLENFETVNCIQPSSDFTQTPSILRNSDTINRYIFSNLSGSSLECNISSSVAEQPTIEDLQRNVSDLEKHAHDLEHKLNARNRRQSEYDEHIRDLESKYEERDAQFQKTQANLLKLRDEYTQLLQQRNQKTVLEEELRQQVEHLQNALRNQELQTCSTSVEGTHSETESVVNPVLQQSLKMFFSVSTNDAFEKLIITPDIGDAESNQSGGLMLALNEQLEQFISLKDNNSSISTPKIVEGFHKLQISLENSEKQKKELQAKCAKLIKKLKQYKQKNDDLQSSSGDNSFLKSPAVESSNDFTDLNITIEEELKSQVRQLEEKLEKSKKLEELQRIERKKLLKRIDILSASNERVAEMQARQHLEVRMYQARIHELEENLNSLQDWESAMLTEDEVTKPLPSLECNVNSNLEWRIPTGTLQKHSLGENHLQFKNLQEAEKCDTINSETQSPINLENEKFKDYSPETRKNNNLILEMQTLQDAHNFLISTNSELIKQIEEKTTQLQDSKLKEIKLQENLESLQTKAECLQETLNQTRNTLFSLSKEFHILKQQNEINVLNDLQKGNYLQTTKTIEEVTTQLHEKEAEVLQLKQYINNIINEDGTEKLIIENFNKNQEIQLFKLQIKELQEDKEELESNAKLQNSTEKQMEVQQERSSRLDDQNTIQQLQSQIKNLLSEKDYTDAELQVLNQHVLELISQEDKIKDLNLKLDLKNSEIKELVMRLETVQLSSSPISSLPVDYVKLNTQWEAIVDDRCKEIANLWQIHLAQREEEFKAIEFRLREELNSLQAHNHNAGFIESAVSTISGLKFAEPLEETDTYSSMKKTLDNMKAALESQEVEIITLKEQLAIRSAEYARLAAQFDPFKLKSFSTSEIIRSETDSLVPKTELDLALYMLHQRDMRCEEMTLELLSLLEERDTLQLKLSNTLRQIESIKTQNSNLYKSWETAPNDNATNAKHLFNTSNVVDELNQKLSELQTVKYAKDKIIKEEREERSRQMQKIQNDVAKMPSAAISKLIGHNLEQRNQSPSRILLNWLWGSNVGNNSESMD